MEKAIVCGVDGSADSSAALAVAARLAERVGARLVLANVVEHVPSPYATVGAIDGYSAARPAARLLETMAERADAESAEKRVVIGFAAERLADLADEENAELIVVGSRGRGALKAAFLGSVATSLIGVARVPVLVVPPGARES
jgi:nucleotide-binding universal stress UspA family protein